MAQTVDMTQGGAGGSSSTVVRAVSLLEALAAAPPEGLGVSELSREIGANRSTVYRIIAALRPLGYVREGSQPGTVRLGFRVVELGEKVLGGLDVRTAAAPHLRELATSTGETCHLGVLDGVDVVYADKAESEQSIRLFSVPGKRMPIYCTAMGKALLAAMDADSLAWTLDRVEIKQRTKRTVADRPALERDLERIRKRGWSTDLEENEIGTRCVGVAILNRDDEPIAAISASGPAGRMTREALAIHATEVKATVELIERKLGRVG
jgi:IclR family transcriptional regulator, KDG regulon repressor